MNSTNHILMMVIWVVGSTNDGNTNDNSDNDEE
jgi:hypothetical protein